MGRLLLNRFTHKHNIQAMLYYNVSVLKKQGQSQTSWSMREVFHGTNFVGFISGSDTHKTDLHFLNDASPPSPMSNCDLIPIQILRGELSLPSHWNSLVGAAAREREDGVT